jgi:hypothetical protein
MDTWKAGLPIPSGKVPKNKAFLEPRLHHFVPVVGTIGEAGASLMTRSQKSKGLSPFFEAAE